MNENRARKGTSNFVYTHDRFYFEASFFKSFFAGVLLFVVGFILPRSAALDGDNKSPPSSSISEADNIANATNSGSSQMRKEAEEALRNMKAPPADPKEPDIAEPVGDVKTHVCWSSPGKNDAEWSFRPMDPDAATQPPRESKDKLPSDTASSSGTRTGTRRRDRKQTE